MPLEDEIRNLVKADSRTRVDIAAAADIHVVNLSQFISGARSLPLKTLQRLASALGCDITLRRKPRKK